MAVVQLENVTKRFGSIVAVDNASFELEKGKILALLGPSGCGKTTTLRMVAGFESPNEGNILISGNSVLGKRPYERNVGLLFQDYALFPHMTVEQNVSYGLRRRRFEVKEIKIRVKEMLDLVQLRGFENRRPAQLSGGQQQRVALARALATRPEVVLLDEPLSALDAKLRQELRVELKQILTKVDATTILVTHDQEEAMGLGDTLVVMNEGRIVRIGDPTEIYNNPQSKFVAEFIGRSNWLPGQLGDVGSDGYRDFKLTNDLIVKVPDTDYRAANYELCLRPERIKATAEHEIPDDYVNQLKGSIQDIAHLGAELHFVIEIDRGQLLTVSEQFTGQSLQKHGEIVTLAFRPCDCIVVPSDS